ncbi:3-dehydroquinate synthase [Sphingomonas sp. BGYR3]|uniref:3-dehydroquinate synthase n=1 Tax=Sphingomonas sp. BGYR3 TaxID=2975483 RepID=UPI0021A7E58D|nr:3-dehydroquinate synthase [Sphingomonas sp. BGYR3]MDG5488089.1 3-dehydroquinate synthase [Sphingomonas sp. BGYR3]
MTTIPVSLGDRSYDVRIERGLIDRAGEALAPLSRGRPMPIITDANVAIHAERLGESLAAAGIASERIVLAPGERTKGWDTLEVLTDRLLDMGVERSDHVIALGGGVIGDLVGFACSILKRGCNFIQVPTTLLAQVDSSVGGKTAINTRAGKNLIGAFHQPALVLIDPDVLDSLPARELRAGYAEVVKYGLIDDPDFFAWCEEHGAALLDGDPVARQYAIARSVRAKARIVGADERETAGTRALLNLGHTFGHALEAETGFSDRLLHGEGVAAGMALAFAYSASKGLCPDEDAARVAAHLRASGLPDGLAAAHVHADGETLVGHMLHDKKMTGGTLPFLLARGIGRTYLDKTVDLADVAAFLDAQPRTLEGVTFPAG